MTFLDFNMSSGSTFTGGLSSAPSTGTYTASEMQPQRAMFDFDHEHYRRRIEQEQRIYQNQPHYKAPILNWKQKLRKEIKEYLS